MVWLGIPVDTIDVSLLVNYRMDIGHTYVLVIFKPWQPDNFPLFLNRQQEEEIDNNKKKSTTVKRRSVIRENSQ